MNKKKNKKSKRRNFNNQVSVLSQKPQCMGVGTGSLFVTYTYHHSTAVLEVKQLTIQEMLNYSQELVLKKNEYMYCKIQYIKAVIMPRSTTGGIAYMLLNWANNHDYTANQIMNSDSAKIIPGYQINTKIYTYFPPNLIVNGTSVHNLREYATTAIFSNYPGYFYFYGTFAFTIRFEIKVVFRGAQQFEINSLIKDLNLFKMGQLFKKKEDNADEDKKAIKEMIPPIESSSEEEEIERPFHGSK